MEVWSQSREDMRLPRFSRDPGMLLKSFHLGFGADDSGPLHATDSWNFGTLIYEIFNGAFNNSEQLSNKGVIPQVTRVFHGEINV